MTPSSEQCPGIGGSAATDSDLARDRPDGAYQPKRSTISDRSRQMRPTRGRPARACSGTQGLRHAPLLYHRLHSSGQDATRAPSSRRGWWSRRRGLRSSPFRPTDRDGLLDRREHGVTRPEGFQTAPAGQDYRLNGLPRGAVLPPTRHNLPVVCPGGRQPTAARTARGAARRAQRASP
jgi:hypothetical protein